MDNYFIISITRVRIIQMEKNSFYTMARHFHLAGMQFIPTTLQGSGTTRETL